MTLRHAKTPARLAAASLAAVALMFTVGAAQAGAASSAGCEGGGYVIVTGSGRTVAAATAGGALKTTIPSTDLGAAFLVKGKYIEFTVVSATFGVENWLFTGAANKLDITGGRRTPVFKSKLPDHRGLTLSSAVDVDISGADLVIGRTGTGLSMKIQAKDCANGGVFQMEPQRADGATTDITHTLDPEAFYFDNPNFRAREGEIVPFKDTTLPVPSRINIANDFSPKFVGRDSAQVATRIAQGCPNTITAPKLPTRTALVDHCGGVSVWRVSSGGRMGQVMGEDSTEVAPPPTNCTHQCQAQNRVRGQSVVLGFPFPVPGPSRLQPRTPS